MIRETVDSLHRHRSGSEIHHGKKLANVRLTHRKDSATHRLERGPPVQMFSSFLMKERRFQLSEIPLITKKSKSSHNSVSTSENTLGRKS